MPLAGSPSLLPPLPVCPHLPAPVVCPPAGWDLINEPRCYGCGTALQQWAAEMAAYVKGLDPNHLVTVGEEGFYPAGQPQVRRGAWDVGRGTWDVGVGRGRGRGTWAWAPGKPGAGWGGEGAQGEGREAHPHHLGLWQAACTRQQHPAGHPRAVSSCSVHVRMHLMGAPAACWHWLQTAANPQRSDDWATKEGQSFVGDHSSPNIDFMAVHLWVNNW